MPLPLFQEEVIILDNIDYKVAERGTRDKRLFYRIKNFPDLIRTDRSCIFKECRFQKNENLLLIYEDIWGEVIAYWIGTLINIEVSKAYIAKLSPNNDNKYIYGSLSEYVYSESSYRFIMARELLTRILPEYRFEKSEDHALELIHEICKNHNVQNYEYHFSKMLLFDLLIGNGDRHQDNWAILYSREELFSCKISPLYDNGSSFMFSSRMDGLNAEDMEKYFIKTGSKLKHKRTDKKFLKCNDIIEVCLNLSPEACYDFNNDIQNLKNNLPLIKEKMISLNLKINDPSANAPSLLDTRIDFICAYIEYRINALSLKI